MAVQEQIQWSIGLHVAFNVPTRRLIQWRGRRGTFSRWNGYGSSGSPKTSKNKGRPRYRHLALLLAAKQKAEARPIQILVGWQTARSSRARRRRRSPRPHDE